MPSCLADEVMWLAFVVNHWCTWFLWGTAYLSAHFAVVKMHQLVGIGARFLLHFHGGIRKLGAHEETIMQVISTATPPVPRLGYFTWNRTTRTQPQVSGGTCPCYSVTYSGCGECIYKCRFPRSWKMAKNKKRLKLVSYIKKKTWILTFFPLEKKAKQSNMRNPSVCSMKG